MSTIDIFSKVELTKEKVFEHLLKPNTICRSVSPFFKLENLNCNNSQINLETSFTQKSTLFDLLQLFYKVKDITPNEKITFEFLGLIKGTQTIYFIEDEDSCILREKFEFSLYNQFNFPLLDLMLSLFFYIDSFIKNLRLKNIIYKDYGIKKHKNDLQAIRSYIVIGTDTNVMSSFFESLNKFALWLLPSLSVNNNHDSYELDTGKEFTLSFFLPILPNFSCKVIRKDLNKIVFSFSNPILKGKNSWSLFPCEKEIIIENTVELEQIETYLELIWLILGNTLVKYELNNWNKRLKELAEKSQLYTVPEFVF